MAEVFESENRAGEEGSAKQRIARVYAEALLNVAEQRGVAREIDQELQGIVTKVFATSPDIERGLASPVLKRSAKTPILASAFQGSVSELLFNFLNVLNSKDRLVLVRNVAFAYSDLLDERANRLRVSVRSAVPLTEEQSEKLRQSIGQSTGKEVILAAKVDANLLGGMIVQVGDKVFDSSVRTRIEAIRNQLLGRSSYEIQAGRDRFSSRG